MFPLRIRTATQADLESLARLFDGYRVFYEQSSNLEAAKAFLEERFREKDSIIFVAEQNGALVGFTQLYPTFSSVSMERFYILNDLFVLPVCRGQGIGAFLLRHAQAFTKSHGYKGLALETATDNPAQALYERLGWEKSDGFYHYFWKQKR